ncbi:unnamed protein product [Ranitomeya imitator]|uniref:P-type domain-containing protein n=1 Tax=Ranitomeya imitator TaxID=111125 RepID=A0ABN9LBM0_9NEOB|nr:unnamed protein product [Ranitomeya imitator]
MIENLRDIVKRKMRDTRPNNADELKAAIKATWASITPQQRHRLIASMPRCIDALMPNAPWSPRIGKTAGFPGIGRQQCVLRGCCFDSSIRGVIWCYQPLETTTTSTSTHRPTSTANQQQQNF